MCPELTFCCHKNVHSISEETYTFFSHTLPNVLGSHVEI